MISFLVGLIIALELISFLVGLIIALGMVVAFFKYLVGWLHGSH